MNTQENNKLIAEFMGISIDGEFAYIEDEGSPLEEVMPINKLNYHESWAWLMPVVDKIEDYLSDNVGKVGYFDECLSSNNLEVRYQAVVEFINEYNKR